MLFWRQMKSWLHLDLHIFCSLSFAFCTFTKNKCIYIFNAFLYSPVYTLAFKASSVDRWGCKCVWVVGWDTFHLLFCVAFLSAVKIGPLYDRCLPAVHSCIRDECQVGHQQGDLHTPRWEDACCCSGEAKNEEKDSFPGHWRSRRLHDFHLRLRYEQIISFSLGSLCLRDFDTGMKKVDTISFLKFNMSGCNIESKNHLDHTKL